METKINIAEILKNKPKNTKLYSPLFGDVYFLCVEDGIISVEHHDEISVFFDNSRYYNYPESEPLLFPSREIRNWRKFTWKKGDVLVSNDGKREVLFKTWVNDSYTKFVGIHCLIINGNEEVEYDNGTTVFNTKDFRGIKVKDAAQTYIKTIEEKLGGKLNCETLEVEKTQPEFKPFDKVLVRDSYDDMWRACFFSHIREDDGRYVTTCFTWKFCIPYEGNEHLLGTIKNVGE